MFYTLAAIEMLGECKEQDMSREIEKIQREKIIPPTTNISRTSLGATAWRAWAVALTFLLLVVTLVVF